MGKWRSRIARGVTSTSILAGVLCGLVLSFYPGLSARDFATLGAIAFGCLLVLPVSLFVGD